MVAALQPVSRLFATTFKYQSQKKRLPTNLANVSRLVLPTRTALSSQQSSIVRGAARKKEKHKRPSGPGLHFNPSSSVCRKSGRKKPEVNLPERRSLGRYRHLCHQNTERGEFKVKRGEFKVKRGEFKVSSIEKLRDSSKEEEKTGGGKPDSPDPPADVPLLNIGFKRFNALPATATVERKPL